MWGLFICREQNNSFDEDDLQRTMGHKREIWILRPSGVGFNQEKKKVVNQVMQEYIVVERTRPLK